MKKQINSSTDKTFQREGPAHTIDGRQQIDDELQESAERLSLLIHAMPDIVIFKDGQGQYLEANDFTLHLFGLDGLDYRGKTDIELAELTPFYRDVLRGCVESDDAAWRSQTISRSDEIIPHPDGSNRIFDVIKTPTFYPDGSRKGLVVVGRDVTERKQAEEALRETRNELERRVEERTAELRKVNEQLIQEIEERKLVEKSLKITEQEKSLLLNSTMDLVVFHATDMKILWGNQVAAASVNMAQDDLVGRFCWDIWHQRSEPCHGCPVLLARDTGKPQVAEISSPDGREWFIRGYPLNDREGQLIGIAEFCMDITKRKQAEQESQNAKRDLEKTLKLIEAVLSDIPIPVFYKDTEGRYLGVNHAFTDLMGFTPEYYKGKTVMELWPSEFSEVYHQNDLDLIAKAEKQVYEFKVIDKNGVVHPAIWAKDVFRDEKGQVAGIVGAFQDITERIQSEKVLRRRLTELEALHTISTALRAAKARDDALPILLDATLTALETDTGIIWLYCPEGNELRAAVGRGWFQQLSESPIKPGEGIAGTVFVNGQVHISAEFARDPLARAAVQEQIPLEWGGACVPLRAGSLIVGVFFISVPLPRQLTPEEVSLLESLAAIGGATLHRMSLHDETVRQLEHLKALYRIDQAINTGMDLSMTLDIFLEQVTNRLNVDAASVLVLNSKRHTLEYAAGHGFQTHPPLHNDLRLNDGYAEQVLLEREIVHIPNLRNYATDSSRLAGFLADGFITYYGIPLIAKGQVKGILEVFQRTSLTGDPDWLEFFETLAGQAAIAIDSAQLFENLQRSNMELALAYDATIEGWSKALDLRDKETEGHTLRVTEMAVQLARAAGMSDEQIIHLRRGALLHDIGKMGIPDSILLKPAELTVEEQSIMRKHPTYAYEMLSPISYLHPALDIPYCHHEKWDGTGYPRGLCGNQIPLAARIFAVVDVYDALTSDRPYRKACPQEQALEYIRSMAGKHFDPQVVLWFLQM